MIIVCAIVAAIAIPSVVNIVRNQRLNSAVKTVVSMLDYARSDALMSHTDVTVCAYDEADNSKCPVTTDWSGGIKLMQGQFVIYRPVPKPVPPVEVTDQDPPMPKLDFYHQLLLWEAPVNYQAHVSPNNPPNRICGQHQKIITVLPSYTRVEYVKHGNGVLAKAGKKFLTVNYYKELATKKLDPTDASGILALQHPYNAYEAADVKEVNAVYNMDRAGITQLWQQTADTLIANIKAHIAEHAACFDRLSSQNRERWHPYTTRYNRYEISQQTISMVYGWMQTEINNFFNAKSVNETNYLNWLKEAKDINLRKQKYEKDLAKYNEDMIWYNKQPPPGFEIKNQKVVLNNNKIATNVNITADANMLVANDMLIKFWDDKEHDLIPVKNTKILISDIRGDSHAQTICVNALGMSEVSKGNITCSF